MIDKSFSRYQAATRKPGPAAPQQRQRAAGARPASAQTAAAQPKRDHGVSDFLPNASADKVAGALYLLILLNLLFGLGFFFQGAVLFFEKNRYIRFHAAQAIMLGICAAVIGVLFYALSGPIWSGTSYDPAGYSGFTALMITSTLTCLLGLCALALFIGWLWVMRATFRGQPRKLPVLGRVALDLTATLCGIPRGSR
jgi:uncharacterized membrane protein